MSSDPCCYKRREPCPSDGCINYDLVQSLYPSGILWRVRGVLGRFMEWQAMLFNDLMMMICQEEKEVIPCESQRLLPEWARLYGYPECVELTKERLCEWLGIINDPSCPIGSIGFYNRIFEFVDLSATVEYPNVGKGSPCCGKRDCPCQSDIVIVADPSEYFYVTRSDGLLKPIQDLENPCNEYFIPAIECLRCWISHEYSLGYATTGYTNCAHPISGVPLENQVFGDAPSLW